MKNDVIGNVLLRLSNLLEERHFDKLETNMLLVGSPEEHRRMINILENNPDLTEEECLHIIKQNENSVFYIAYGSNISKKQMEERCPGAEPIDAQALKGYRLDFHQYLTIEKDPNYSVPIVIWKITRKHEATLDSREGVYIGIYRKEYIVLTIEGKKYACLVYIMNDIPERRNVVPEPKYLDTCLNGYRDFGFDPATLLEAYNRVRSFEET